MESESKIVSVEKHFVVKKGFYRGKRSISSYYVDLGDMGKFYYLEGLEMFTSAPYFHESWLSENYEY